MAQCKLTPHEFIQNAFSPMVSVMCSPLVDQACQKNNLSFIEMIQPFCKINTEAHFRDPSGNTITIRNLRITMLDVNSRPPQPTLARKFLNESVSLSASERSSTLQIGNSTVDIPASVPWFEAWRETFLQVQFPSDHEFTKHYLSCILVVSSAEANPADLLLQMNQQIQQLQNIAPAKLPKWFSQNVLQFYVLLHDAHDGGAEKAECAFENIKNTYGAGNCFFLQMNSRPPGQIDDQTHLPDPWSQFLIRHFDGQEGSDHDSSPRTPAEVGGLTGLPMPSRLAGEGSCDGESSPKETELAQEAGEGTPSGAVPVTRHPLSPNADGDASGAFGPMGERSQSADPPGAVLSHINSNVWAGQGGIPGGPQAAHGACLTAGDLERLRALVQDFCTKALLPHVERQIQQLSDVVSNKKGVSRSLLSATKRWFGSNKPGMPNVNAPNNAVIYANDAPELQLRRLGDLCFMFGHYTLAFQAYHSAKRDFSADQAWLYYAGALEMAALSAFMQGEPTRKAQEYMEESIVTYLNSCKMPQFATRATLLSTECLKGRGLYGEAAQQFIRMTSEDSDLRSALLLEQAAYCFLKAARPCMARKYAFHAVLAGHRFSKAGQRRHALRCYRQAYQVYENKCWSLAEDHIHFTIGRQAANLKLMAESVKAFAQLLSPLSRQTAAQQAAFLREYVSIQQQVVEEPSAEGTAPELPLPIVEQNSVRVLVGPLPNTTNSSHAAEDASSSQTVPASGVTFEDDDPDTAKWPKLEEALVTAVQKQTPMIFKPTIQMFSGQTDNSKNPVSIVGEPVSVQVQLVNPLQVSLPLQDLQLQWSLQPATSHIAATASTPATVHSSTSIVPSQGIVEAQVLPSLLLPADSCQPVVLSLTPRSAGELQISGITYKLAVPATEAGVPAASVFGRQLFQVREHARPQKGRKEVQSDKRLQVLVVPSAPCLQVNFFGQSNEMLCGEVQRVVMEFRNIGSAPLTALHVASSTPELFVFEGGSTGSSLGGVVRIPLDKLAGEQLGVGQVHTAALWLRAPDVPMEASLDLLFYYENVVSNAVPRYRLVRHQWSLCASAGLLLSASAVPSCSSHQATSDNSGRLLNLPLQAKNLNQAQDTVMTEVALIQILLASSEWSLCHEVVIPKGVHLQAQEKMYFLLQAKRLSGKVNDKNSISRLWLSDNTELQSVLGSSPYLDFFSRYAHWKSPSESAAEALAEQTAMESKSEPDLVNLCLLVQWQASVVVGQGAQRSAIGQTCVLVRQTGMAALWPPAAAPTTSLQPLPPTWPLEAFRTNAAASTAPSSSAEGFPALEALQKLVIFTISHPPRVVHDFKSSRLCVVPVQLLLQNCSHQLLLVKINTLSSNSSMLSTNKSQLYSPHSSAAFRWVGLAKAWLELPGHASATVALSAALGSPGTFDMGAHLEVWCCEPGAPAADAVNQSWRVESALIVSATS